MSARACVLLPAYNEGANLAQVVAAARAVRVAGCEIVVLVVNDGSKDDTAAVAEKAGATVISHPVNRGVGAGFRTGADWSRGEGFDYLIHMDSDGQFLPSEIPLLLEPVMRGEADVALGSRFTDWSRRPDNLAAWKSLALSTMARSIGVLTGYRLTDLSCGFRCMNRKVLEVVNPSFDYDYIQETLIQALAIGARIAEIPVTVLYEKSPARKGMSGAVFRYSRRFMKLTAYSMFNFYRDRFRGA